MSLAISSTASTLPVTVTAGGGSTDASNDATMVMVPSPAQSTPTQSMPTQAPQAPVQAPPMKNIAQLADPVQQGGGASGGGPVAGAALTSSDQLRATLQALVQALTALQGLLGVQGGGAAPVPSADATAAGGGAAAPADITSTNANGSTTPPAAAAAPVATASTTGNIALADGTSIPAAAL